MRISVLIAGAGVAGLEAALALQHLAGDRVALTLVAPERHLTYRPLSVAEPFGGPPVLRFPLAAIAEDRGFTLRRDAIAGVDPAARRGDTPEGRPEPYDVLVLATGARQVEAVPGALTFRGPRDAGRVEALVGEVVRGAVA